MIDRTYNCYKFNFLTGENVFLTDQPFDIGIFTDGDIRIPSYTELLERVNEWNRLALLGNRNIIYVYTLNK